MPLVIYGIAHGSESYTILNWRLQQARHEGRCHGAGAGCYLPERQKDDNQLLNQYAIFKYSNDGMENKVLVTFCRNLKNPKKSET